MPNLAYELATGNNSVLSLAWDAPRSTLYAATECEYMDRLGNYHDYRHAKIRYEKEMQLDGRGQPIAAANGESEYEDETGDEDDFDEEKCWPKNAYHDERYFGYAFDSGDHCLSMCNTLPYDLC